MESLQSIVWYLEGMWGYASRCGHAPVSAPGCGAFWTWAGIAAGLVVLLVVRDVVGRLRAAIVSRKRQAELARVADRETMANYRADLEKLYSGSQDEDVEQRIRRALDERKLMDQRQPKGAVAKEDGG